MFKEGAVGLSCLLNCLKVRLLGLRVLQFLFDTVMILCTLSGDVHFCKEVV